MKRILLSIFSLLMGLTVSAQYYQDAVNKDMLHIREARTLQRVQIDLPVIDNKILFMVLSFMF